MSENKWVSVKQELPPENEVVKVHQLWGWAIRRAGKWIAMGISGNLTPIMWEPEWWGREIHLPINPEPPTPAKEN